MKSKYLILAIVLALTLLGCDEKKDLKEHVNKLESDLILYEQNEMMREKQLENMKVEIDNIIEYKHKADSLEYELKAIIINGSSTKEFNTKPVLLGLSQAAFIIDSLERKLSQYQNYPLLLQLISELENDLTAKKNRINDLEKKVSCLNLQISGLEDSIKIFNQKEQERFVVHFDVLSLKKMLTINLGVKSGVLFNKQITVNDSVLASFPLHQEWNLLSENEIRIVGIPQKTKLKNIVIHPGTHAIRITQKEDNSFWLESALKDKQTPVTNQFVISYK